MADNIKIVGNILSTTTVSRYSSQDTNLIASRKLQENFGGTNDYIEYYVYDIGGNLLSLNYNYLNYKLPTSTGLTPGVSTLPNTRGSIQTTDVGIDSTLATTTSSLYPIIEIDPVKDLQDLGYSSGEFQVRYNLFQNKISDFSNEALFVKEISQDRTEIRLASTTLTNDQIESGSVALIDKINNSNYYVDYLLNFGTNEQYIAVNVALNKDPGGYEILFKLYQPLPLTIQEKQTLWIVEEKVNPYDFDINLDKLITPAPPPTLRKPNFDINIENQGTISTVYGNYSNLISNLQSLQSSSYSQIQNLLNTQSIDINIDYTDFNNFAFFGSTFQRVTNFYNKVKEIEDSKNFINKYTTSVATTASLQTTINQYSASINTTISQFDGYEYYLYFESSSYAWPKSGSLKPYSLLSTGSATTLTWYNALTGSAQNYDSNNYDNLEFAVPAFIRDDENNQPFLLFLNMIGQYFDNIWIYLKSVTNINLANNNLETGISKDLVYQQLKSLGVKLYNSQAGESVDGYLIGANTGSSIFDNNFTITGSYLNNIPRKDLVAELYKRIYHNLPLLLKTKGTVAGLEYLTSTFGIPSKTYYTIGSESFYTPTGSSATASILNVKEFGGSNKAKLIKGYNTDKVRIVTNVITGSVLHPELSLQTFPTASSAFIDDDLHYIDISFSPQTQIDTYISKSVSSNNPTWSLDNYIGDPRQQYTSSYPDLDDQRKLYFETGVPGFNPFTASLLDYNGFIRLIEYFDNSLFKMLADFVPERASLSTGITINSPVLERNKAVYSVPNVYTQSINEAEYPATSITAQYGKSYDDMRGDKKPFFTGEISGSIVNIHQYFEDNYNPYEDDWDVYNLQHTISQSIDMNSFLHSDWNVLLNNVSKSVESNIRKNIEYIYGTTGSITSSAQLQDSNLSLTSYVNSRYEGAKVTSLLYNTYTSASYTGSDGFTIVTGDKSFGKTAAIDRNSYKVGWVKTVSTESLNFYSKTPINIEYLIDSSNQITELNSYNNNLFEVQNIFKSQNPTIISITDMNQNRKDGIKTIWKGGYSFSPIIYRENGEVMSFKFNDIFSTITRKLGFILSDPNKYSYTIFTRYGTQSFNPSTTLGSDNRSQTFKINNTTSLLTSIGTNSIAERRAIWPYNNFPKISYLPQNLSFTNSRQTIVGPTYRFELFNYRKTNLFHYIGPQLVYDYINEPIPSSIIGPGNNTYKIPRSGQYNIYGNFNLRIDANAPDLGTFKVALIVEKTDEAGYQNDTWQDTNNGFPIISDNIVRAQGGGAQYNNTNGSIKINDGYLTLVLDLPRLINYPLIAGEYIRISLYMLDIQDIYEENNWNVFGNIKLTFEGEPFWGVLNTTLTSTEYIYENQYTSSLPFFTVGTTSQPNDTLNFNTSASFYFYSSSFIGNSSKYSNINNTVSVEKGDFIKFGKFEDPGDYYEIITSSKNPYSAVLSTSILTGSNDMSSNFAILRPKEDETSIILEGRKAIGSEQIEQSILIPYDANDNIKNSIGNIFKTLNTDLK